MVRGSGKNLQGMDEARSEHRRLSHQTPRTGIRATRRLPMLPRRQALAVSAGRRGLWKLAGGRVFREVSRFCPSFKVSNESQVFVPGIGGFCPLLFGHRCRGSFRGPGRLAGLVAGCPGAAEEAAPRIRRQNHSRGLIGASNG